MNQKIFIDFRYFNQQSSFQRNQKSSWYYFLKVLRPKKLFLIFNGRLVLDSGDYISERWWNISSSSIGLSLSRGIVHIVEQFLVNCLPLLLSIEDLMSYFVKRATSDLLDTVKLSTWWAPSISFAWNVTSYHKTLYLLN